MIEALKYKAAKLAMGRLNADEVKSTINDLVDQGTYLDEFLDVLGPTRPQMDEVLPALHAAFDHFGIVVPDKEEAVWHLIHLHCRAITSGSVNPLEELSKLIADVYWDYDFHAPTKKYLGDSHGIEGLIGLYWAADDLREHTNTVTVNGKLGEEAWSELNKEIVIESNRWLAQHRLSNK